MGILKIICKEREDEVDGNEINCRSITQLNFYLQHIKDDRNLWCSIKFRGKEDLRWGIVSKRCPVEGKVERLS
jgi:hypothetical protein